MTEEKSEIEKLKDVIKFQEDIMKADKQIIDLQRNTIEHLKMIADDRRVTINQLNEKRWAVRKLDSERPKPCNISKNFMEGRIADMDMEQEWDHALGYNAGI